MGERDIGCCVRLLRWNCPLQQGRKIPPFSVYFYAGTAPTVTPLSAGRATSPAWRGSIKNKDLHSCQPFGMKGDVVVDKALDEIVAVVVTVVVPRGQFLAGGSGSFFE